MTKEVAKISKESSSKSMTLTFQNEKVPSQVLAVLVQAAFEGNILMLPPGQLDRKVYEAVNKTLERIGGKWNRKAKGHTFDEENPQEFLRLILETGEMPPKNPTAFYPTPLVLAARIVEHIPMNAQRILEPSAGTGNIARALREQCQQQGISAHIACCEILPRFQEKLREQEFTVVAEDFLAYQPEHTYDLVVMNPPFSMANDTLAYVAHVLHAWEVLAPGGKLIAIVPAGFAFREEKRIKELRASVETVGTWRDLPAQSFQESGTGVQSVLLEMHN